ncbi:hypothetical protein [Henriciella marina]|uniref:hypothetical protein n=1 Tax=Henriciella marina TaxID=453851 RepID=UPI00035F2B5F|nr:hypothetical protein [Henriciella marina]
MLYEVFTGIVLFGFFTALGLVAIVPLVREASRSDAKTATSLVLCAPALGLAVTTILVVACYFYLGATQLWAWPVTIIAGVLALVLAGRMLWKQRKSSQVSLKPGLGIAAIACVAAIYATPPIVSGPDAVFIRADSSDAFMYVTLSENTRVADRDLLRAAGRGELLADGQTPAATELVKRNPLGLYSARFVDRLRLGTYSILGWFAHLTSLPVSSILWIFGGVTSAASAAAAFSLARVMGAGTRFAALASVAVATGYWQFVAIDRENFSTAHVLPLLLSIAAIWPSVWERLTGSERGFREALPKTIVALGSISVLYAATFIAYIEMLPFALAALLLAAFISIAKMESRPLPALAAFCLPIGVAVGILLLSNQLFHNIAVFMAQLNLAASVDSSIGDYPTHEFMLQNLMTATVGLAWIDGVIRGAGIDWRIGASLEWTISFATTLVLISLAPLTLLRRYAALRFPYALMCAGIIVAFYGVWLPDPYYVLKGMPIAAPFMAVLISVWLSAVTNEVQRASPRHHFNPATVRSLSIAPIASLGAIATFGGVATVTTVSNEYPNYVTFLEKERQFDIRPIIEAAKARQACGLIVSINPVHQQWGWAAYVVEQTAPLHPIYTDGYLTDNAPQMAQLNLDNDVASADFVIAEQGDPRYADTRPIVIYGGLALSALTDATECK